MIDEDAVEKSREYSLRELTEIPEIKNKGTTKVIECGALTFDIRRLTNACTIATGIPKNATMVMLERVGNKFTGAFVVNEEGG